VPRAGLERRDGVETDGPNRDGLWAGHKAASQTLRAGLEFDIADESQGGLKKVHTLLSAE